MPADNDQVDYTNYSFPIPPPLVDGDLTLHLLETRPYDPHTRRGPLYRFAMRHSQSREVLGDIELRVALNDKLRLLGGHIGYEVLEPYRGRRYAARSCRLLLPFARELGINPVIITCDPANTASVRTIESLGAVLIDTYLVELRPGFSRWTSRYHIDFE